MTRLILSDEQAALSRQATEIVARLSPLSHVRQRREAGTSYSAELWAEAIALGWSAIPFSEAEGGLGLGLPEMAVVMEAHGRCLAATPLWFHTMLGARALALAGPSPELEAAIAGTRRIALAVEGEARIDTEGGTLHGQMNGVVGGESADAMIVPAGDGLYLVEAALLNITRLHRLDGHSAANIVIDGVPGRRIGDRSALPAIVADATIALAAEQLGSMTACFEQTVAWLKTRHQFGVPIGSFQALQHRAARMFVEIELCRSAVLAASRCEAHERKRYAALAKARCNEVFLHVAAEAIQLHGGIGMTDEHDIGFFLKRARVAAATLGTAAHHRGRWRRVRGQDDRVRGQDDRIRISEK
jgi:alkylation response protein AidB-like acyl-CoA dehydrogenase